MPCTNARSAFAAAFSGATMPAIMPCMCERAAESTPPRAPSQPVISVISRV